MFFTWFHTILRNRIALWRLKKVQENPAGESGSGFRVLLTAGWRKDTFVLRFFLISENFLYRRHNQGDQSRTSKFDCYPTTTPRQTGRKVIFNEAVCCERGRENKAFTTGETWSNNVCMVALQNEPHWNKQHDRMRLYLKGLKSEDPNSVCVCTWCFLDTDQIFCLDTPFLNSCNASKNNPHQHWGGKGWQHSEPGLLEEGTVWRWGWPQTSPMNHERTSRSPETKINLRYNRVKGVFFLSKGRKLILTT